MATPQNEGDLMEVATGCTTAQLERLVRAWKKGSRKDEAAWERKGHRSRTFSIFPTDDGMYMAKGRLPAEVGALVMRAVEAAGDALFQEVRPPWKKDDPAEAARRRADALALVAERALWAGFGEEDECSGEEDEGALAGEGAATRFEPEPPPPPIRRARGCAGSSPGSRSAAPAPSATR